MNQKTVLKSKFYAIQIINLNSILYNFKKKMEKQNEPEIA